MTPARNLRILIYNVGRALAGLALFACAACGEGTESSGPAPASVGEAAALRDAEAMLQEREPAENAAQSSPDEAPAP